MNSKLRCTACRGYYAHDSLTATRVGLSGVCSSECLEDLKDKARNKRARRIVHRENKHRYGRRLPGQIRDVIRERDGACCRYCGTPNDVQIHHVQDRSQGGGDVEWNLLSLCHKHHLLAHSSKRRWKPILEMTLWLYYAEGLKLPVPVVDRAFREILISDEQEDDDDARE